MPHSFLQKNFILCTYIRKTSSRVKRRQKNFSSQL